MLVADCLPEFPKFAMSNSGLLYRYDSRHQQFAWLARSGNSDWTRGLGSYSSMYRHAERYPGHVLRVVSRCELIRDFGFSAALLDKVLPHDR